MTEEAFYSLIRREEKYRLVLRRCIVRGGSKRTGRPQSYSYSTAIGSPCH